MSKIKNKWWGRFMKYERAAFDPHMDDEYHYDKHKAEHAWEIRDETGTIQSGTEENMKMAWEVLTTGSEKDFMKKMSKNFPDMDQRLLHAAYDHFLCDIEGDLEFVHVLKQHFK